MAKEPPVALDFLGVVKSEDERSASDKSSSAMAMASATGCLESTHVPPVAMSLRTRESSALALKRIFDQINSNAENAEGRLDAGLSRKMSFDGSSAADRAQEWSSQRPSEEEFAEVGNTRQTPNGMRSTFLSLKGYGDNVADLDLSSFRPPHSPERAAFLSNPTAFGSPISHPASQLGPLHGGVAENAHLLSPQWPLHGLFPIQGHSSQAAPGSAFRPLAPIGRQPSAQLTIFYSGRVNVYDEVPADRAHAIMLLAGSGGSWSSHVMNTSLLQAANSSPALLASSAVAAAVALTATDSVATAKTAPFSAPFSAPSLSVVPAPVSVASPSMQSAEVKQPPPAKRCHAELPHARKASLARFLEKRKDRVIQAKVVDKCSETQDTSSSLPQEKNMPNNNNISPPQKRNSLSRSPSPQSKRAHYAHDTAVELPPPTSSHTPAPSTPKRVAC